MINKNETLQRMAYQSMQLLQLASEIKLTLDIYHNSGMGDEVYTGAGATPGATYGLQLTFNEVEGNRLALEGLATYLDANTEAHRKALAKVVGARNLGG